MKVHAFIRDTGITGQWDLKELIRQAMDEWGEDDRIGQLERLEHKLDLTQRLLARLILALVQGKDLGLRAIEEDAVEEHQGDENKLVRKFVNLSQLLRRDIWTELETQ